LIRYDTGDTLIKSNSSCSCGRAFQVIKSISGRDGDVIRTPSGREYGPTLLARVAKGASNILATQIIQDRIDHITILYVPNSKFSEKDLIKFREHMRSYLPSELKIDFKCVTTIEKTMGGKMNFLVSRI